jgi:hypothetical protein
MNKNSTTGPGYALTRLVLMGVIVTQLFFMAGCHGSENNAETPLDIPCTGGGIVIQQPSTTGLYTTATSSVLMAGMVNANYPNVAWSNSSTGDSGPAALLNPANHSCGWAIPYLWVCTYDWYATVPLAMGDNLIKADAYDTAGVLNARVCTTITRTGP